MLGGMTRDKRSRVAAVKWPVAWFGVERRMLRHGLIDGVAMHRWPS